MDPNLLKIISANTSELQQGNTKRTLSQAKDYLYYIHGYNDYLVTKEMNKLHSYLKKNFKGAK
jgi:hypothetical protein